MRIEADVTNFTAGEISPRLRARVDVARYYNGADTLLNMVVMPQGGATRRPGTRYVDDATSQAAACRLVPFIFSVVQPYILEFSAGKVRVYKDGGVVLNAGVPVDVVVPYQAADLKQLAWCQSADTLFLCHPLYPPATLTRSSHTAWTYTAIAVRDGPYLSLNTTDTTLDPSAATGSVTVTASATTGINGGSGFDASDIGRLIRWKGASKWGWLKITAVNSTTQVVATVQDTVEGGAAGAESPLDGHAPSKRWQLGKWCPRLGYPYQPMFWQQRLLFCGTNNEPGAIEPSVSADFTNFAPSDQAGTVTAAHALSWIIADDQVNAIRWVGPVGSAANAQLGIGTTGGEHVMQPASTSAALSATNVQVYRETTYGSADNVQPCRVGKSTLFVGRSGTKLHEWLFNWQVNGYTGGDLTQFAEHLMTAGLTALVYQQSPHQVVWAIRGDGQLIGFTYDREQQVFAPHRHQLGGNFYGGPPIVESIAVIPAAGGSYDELWLAVKRSIGGTTKRTIERMAAFFRGAAVEDATYLDCALRNSPSSSAPTMTLSGFENIAAPLDPPSWSGPGTITLSSALLFNNNPRLYLNGGMLRVVSQPDNYTLNVETLRPMTSLAPAASGEWKGANTYTSFGGLEHLAGETVAAMVDGADRGSVVVAGDGTVSLGSPVGGIACIGYPYTSLVVGLPMATPRAGSMAGKTKRLGNLSLLLAETAACDFGVRITDPATQDIINYTETLNVRSAADALGLPPPLFTGARRVAPRGGYDVQGQFLVATQTPLPMTVLGVFLRADVGEMQP